MKRQMAIADLSTMPGGSVLSTHNKYLFNSTCSSCLSLNCDCCCKQFRMDETVTKASSTSESARTPFDATLCEFLSSTPIVRGGASTSTRRVRSVFASTSSSTNSLRIDRLVRRAAAHVLPSFCVANQPTVVHNTNDNFKNYGDFLVWFV